MSNNISSVKLRKKKLGDGRYSLYLDTCKNREREYEFLKLYIIPEVTKTDKAKNKKTLQLAEAIQAKRVIEIQNGEWGFRQSFREEAFFFDYYKAMAESRLGEESKGNWGNWRSALRHLEKYCNNKNITFVSVSAFTHFKTLSPSLYLPEINI